MGRASEGEGQGRKRRRGHAEPEGGVSGRQSSGGSAPVCKLALDRQRGSNRGRSLGWGMQGARVKLYAVHPSCNIYSILLLNLTDYFTSEVVN